MALRKTIGLKPHNAPAYSNLGIVLRSQQRFKESEVVCRKAIELTPYLPDAYFHLGMVLIRQIEFDEAAAAFKKARELFPAKDSRAEQSRLMQQECRQFTLLDTRFQGVLEGTEKLASAAEKVEFARLCDYKRLYVAAARCYREAFTAQPNLAEMATDSTLYDAARDAALAGAGQGTDSNRLTDKDREAWRKQALGWLQQELVKWGKELNSGNVGTDAQVRRSMQHWQTDIDLAGVRENEALARLSAQERAEWEKLWSAVDSLLRRVPELEYRPYGSTATTKK